MSLVNKSGLLKQPSEDEQQQFKSFQASSINGQHEFLRKNKVNESQKLIGKILLGKEKKLLKAGVKKEDIQLREEDVLNEINNSYQFSDDNALIQIPTQHPFDIGKFHSNQRFLLRFINLI